MCTVIHVLLLSEDSLQPAPLSVTSQAMPSARFSLEFTMAPRDVAARRAFGPSDVVNGRQGSRSAVPRED
jgi:hypothetical protein